MFTLNIQTFLVHGREIKGMPIESIKWKDMGDELLNKGFSEDSIICFKMALEQSPNDIDLWINRGLAHSILAFRRRPLRASIARARELGYEE